MSATSTSRSSIGSFIERAIVALIALIAMFYALGTGAPPASIQLDPSWTAVLGWSWQNQVLFGRDLLFTYGPLGFLHPHASYYPGAFQAFLNGQLVIGATLGLTLGLFLARLAPRSRWLYVAGLACWLPWLDADILWFINIAHAIGALLLRRGEPRRRDLFVAGLLALGLAFFPLVKVSVMWPTLLAAAAATLALLLERRRLEALAFAASGALGFLAMWLACEQSLVALPSFLRGAWEISAGFGDSLGLLPSRRVDAIGFVAVASCGGWLAWQVWVHRRTPGRAAVFLAMGGLVYVGWRAGFTRADAHIHAAFPVMALAMLAASRMVTVPQRAASALAVTAFVVTLLAGMTLGWSTFDRNSWTNRVKELPRKFSPQRDRAAAIADRDTGMAAVRAQYPLTAIRERVGNATVDLWNWEQGVLLAHGMNYHPRPVFQSYSAYTWYLTRRNELFLLGPDAPQFMIFKLQVIDNHLPTSEDPLGLLAVLRRYRPVLAEDGYLLLERRAEALPALEVPAESGLGRLGDWMDVPAHEGLTIATVTMRLGLAGRAYRFFFRAPPLDVDIETADGVVHRFALPHSVLETGFLLSPMPRDTSGTLRLWTGPSMPQVKRLRIVPRTTLLARAIKPKIRFGFAQAPALTAPAEEIRGLADSLYPGFTHIPVEQAGLIHDLVEDDRRALFTHSPAHLRFQPGAGTWRFAGEFGLRSAMLADPGCKGASDGIRLALYRIDAQGGRSPGAVFDIDPAHRPEDAGPRPAEGVLDLVDGDLVEVAIEPRENTSCDWAYVRGLTFTQEASR